MTTLYGRVSNAVSGIYQSIAERTAAFDEMMRKNNDNLSAGIRVAIPAKVVSFDPDKMTVVVQPLVREKIKIGGNLSWETLPQLVDVPVQFPQGGDFAITLPIKANDEGLVIFADMSIDSWWARGGIQNWVDRRRHDLSDGIFIPGVNSVPNVIDDIATDALEIRKKDNTVKITINENDVIITSGRDVTVNAGRDILLTAEDDIILQAGDQIQLNGDLQINGNSYDNHRHSGVESGPSNTGGVYFP